MAVTLRRAEGDDDLETCTRVDLAAFSIPLTAERVEQNLPYRPRVRSQRKC